ncbi:hypothetical protein EW146_g10224 [Bondarzewia mesenterica]|uniref:Uncharacterized protein n=1 Tax=Bondarzewia mesenterica TaxID=1095465 RepID=A0A4V6S146_9AGAM|nr:hypothetical protein EW146_g10224 [Bondarzewia mesenterica]
MSSKILNRRQSHWAMFLSDFDFRLIWTLGNSNIADAPSRHSDFIPKKRDDTQLVQNQRILTDIHMERLLPSPSSDSPVSTFSSGAITTLAIDSSDLLERFKTMFQEDIEWRESLDDYSCPNPYAATSCIPDTTPLSLVIPDECALCD